jgi:hypothetical protein
MADVKQCDICNGIYVRNQAPTSNRNVFRIYEVDVCKRIHKYHDLCPSCYNIIQSCIISLRTLPIKVCTED